MHYICHTESIPGDHRVKKIITKRCAVALSVLGLNCEIHLGAMSQSAATVRQLREIKNYVEALGNEMRPFAYIPSQYGNQLYIINQRLDHIAERHNITAHLPQDTDNNTINFFNNLAAMRTYAHALEAALNNHISLDDAERATIARVRGDLTDLRLFLQREFQALPDHLPSLRDYGDHV